MSRAIVIILALVFALSACAPKDTSTLLEGPDVDYGKSLFSDLQARNVKALRERMDPEVLASAAPSVFDQMAGLFPPAAPLSVMVAGLNWTKVVSIRTRLRRVNISLQYEFENQWLLASARWRETESGDKIIEAMNVQLLPRSLQEINSFELKGKGIANYVSLVLAIAFPFFCVAVFIVCLRTPMPRKRKILWCIGILFGFCQISLNWTSGAISVSPLHFQFLAAGWGRAGLVAPYVISVSIPLFAILFLWRRHQGKFAGGETAGIASESP